MASSTGRFPIFFGVQCLLRDSENDLYACIITGKFKRNYIIASDQRRDENMARHFNHRRKYTVCLSRDSFAYNKSLQKPEQLASAN